jgi:hypothetical protein
LLQTRDTHYEAVELSVVRALNHTAISIPEEVERRERVQVSFMGHVSA